MAASCRKEGTKERLGRGWRTELASIFTCCSGITKATRDSGYIARESLGDVGGSERNKTAHTQNSMTASRVCSERDGCQCSVYDSAHP